MGIMRYLHQSDKVVRTMGLRFFPDYESTSILVHSIFF